MLPFVELLTAELPTDIEWHLMGSYRRNAEVVGDLDVLVVTEDGELAGDLWKPGITLPPSVDWDRMGPKIAQGSLFLSENDYVHIDIWSCTPKMRGAMLMFSTGPMSLNVVQRKRAIGMGYRLSQNGLFDKDNKRQLDDGTEENIYHWLNLDYMTPEQREKWADKKPPSPKPYPPVNRTRREEMPTTPQKMTPAKAAQQKPVTEEKPANVTPIKPATTPRKSAARNNRAVHREQAWAEAPEPTETAAQATAAVKKVEEQKKDEGPKLEIGGIEVTVSQAKQALVFLVQAKSMFVRQPLAAKSHPLSATDYHGVAATWFAAHPEDRKKKHPTKSAFIEAVKEMIAKAEGESK
ncbi:hypothetical protein ACIBSW_34625 [Actinoplanes sp. NPDC049668]|uniref:hypothetical protein n=1 Tax=unclassified Actinoplanes TaxID=2626549 RepID=UPI0033BD2176